MCMCEVHGVSKDRLADLHVLFLAVTYFAMTLSVGTRLKLASFHHEFPLIQGL